MQAAQPALPPRHEAFCRHVVRGATLTSAAIEAGYAPGSARQRGSELYARDDVRQRIRQLAAEQARAEEEQRETFIHRLQDLYDDCMRHGERRTALRALTIELQLRGLDAASLNRRARAERDREAEVAELCGPARAEAEQTMTNHVRASKSTSPEPGPEPGPAPAPVPVRAGVAHVLARAGFREGRILPPWLGDTALPCLLDAPGLAIDPQVFLMENHAAAQARSGMPG